MPALYAHNKFGKKVINNLPPNLKKIIRKHPNSFRLGLQGPDILFFYKPWCKNTVNKTGRSLHRDDAYQFFSDALNIVKEYGFDSASHSYILGFICHFALDSKCHPLVNQLMSDTNCGHMEIEGDFEHYLLESDNKVPNSYPMHKLIPTDKSSSESLAPFFPELSPEELHTAIIHMKLVKRFFVAPKKAKQTTLRCLLFSTFHYKIFKGQMIESNANKKCRHHMEKLHKQFLSAIPISNRMIEQFETCLHLGGNLPDEFRGDYYGNEQK